MVSRLPSGCSCWQLPRPKVLRSHTCSSHLHVAHQHAAVAPWHRRRRRLHGSHEIRAADGRHRWRGRRRQDSNDSESSSGREGSRGSPQRPPAQGDGAGAWEDLATDDEWEKVTRQRCGKRGSRNVCTNVECAGTSNEETKVRHLTTWHLSAAAVEALMVRRHSGRQLGGHIVHHQAVRAAAEPEGRPHPRAT